MKIFLTILLFFVTLIIVLGFNMAERKTETLPYTVVKKMKGFEIRNYESALFTSTTVPYTTYEEASGKGFRILAGYIFGANEREEKISMTTPVIMEISDTMKMWFMVPSEKTLESLPRPKNSKVSFEISKPVTLAAIEFGGWASDEKIELHKQKLIKLLEENNLSHTGKFLFMGYNPPYQPVNRRNEVLVEIQNFNSAQLSKQDI
jgi:hypothetical protein